MRVSRSKPLTKEADGSERDERRNLAGVLVMEIECCSNRAGVAVKMAEDSRVAVLRLADDS
jgi:hypothetical protein